MALYDFLWPLHIPPEQLLNQELKLMAQKRIWFLTVALIFFQYCLKGQNGPYPIFDFPNDDIWQVFDSVQNKQNIAASLVWQPNTTNPVQGVVISKHGLALLPASILGKSQQKMETWLSADPEGTILSLPKSGELALLESAEDISKEILRGIPDTISPKARSIKVANALQRYKLAHPVSSGMQQIRSLYQSNRFYRFEWINVQARLLGQVFAPGGQSLVIVRLEPLSNKENFTFSWLPLHNGKESISSPLFVGGMQTAPNQPRSPAQINFYYTQLLSLINETQVVLTSNWAKQAIKPNWLNKLEAASELDMPLHPFADPARAIQEVQWQENKLLESLKEDREAWWKYQQLQQNIQSGYEELAPLLIAEKLSLEIIPTRLQLFRLVRMLMQWERTMLAQPALLEKRMKNLSAYLDFFYQSFNPEVDQMVAEQLFNLYLERVRYDLQSPFAINQWNQAEKKTQMLVAALYQKSNLTDGESVKKALNKDPAQFFLQLKNDYAYLFVQKWEQEHRERIKKQLGDQEEALQEKQRILIKGMLTYSEKKASVEKGGLSFTAIPDHAEQAMTQISPHLLGNYPEGSPVLSLDGRLVGITFYEGGTDLLGSQNCNSVISLDFLHKLEKRYPAYLMVRELFSK